ncbi:ESPR domain-containing protein, partial [Paraburkholderia sediminicola]|uniref:ESPR domain-containing protein n=1 Tax=Paraburkholderia sediminicola TaxID=458836 RepID=UPI0038BACE5F
MNHVYRIISNAVTGGWAVASELTKGRGKASKRKLVMVAAVAVGTAAGVATDANAGAAANSFVSGILGTASCLSSTNPGAVVTDGSQCNSGSGGT